MPAVAGSLLKELAVGAGTLNQNGTYQGPITFKGTNIGATNAQPAWNDMAYLLPANGALTNSTPMIGVSARGTPLAPGASYTTTVTYTTPASAGPGNYTLIVKADTQAPNYNGGGSNALGGGALVES